MYLKLILTILIFSNFSFGQTEQRKKTFNLENGLAINGYDAVSYFMLNKAEEGKVQFQYIHEGIKYNFANQAHKELFVKNPKKYEPQYGGWCAYAMGATNTKVEIDPETFKIIDGKLYLFFHNWVNNTLLKWNKDEGNFKSKANKNWLEMYK